MYISSWNNRVRSTLNLQLEMMGKEVTVICFVTYFQIYAENTDKIYENIQSGYHINGPR
jgi:diphthamide biosynthesis methyltransferase